MNSRRLIDTLSDLHLSAPVSIAWSVESMNGGFAAEPVTALYLKDEGVVLHAESLEIPDKEPRLPLTVADLLKFLADLPQPAEVRAHYHLAEAGRDGTEPVINAFPFDSDVWLSTPSWAAALMPSSLLADNPAG